MSNLPTPENDYAVSPTTPLTSELWRVTVVDIAKRLRILESIKVSFEQIENAGIDAVLARINVILQPAIDEVNALLAQARAESAEINDILTEIETRGVPATSITTTAVGPVAPGNVQASLAGLMAQITASANAASQALAAESAARAAAITAEASVRAAEINRISPRYATVQKFM
ncbi:hypothetical protein [Pannonibacter tanglangensis]|uniref:Uncharacterized protein n=1 Tax=Pannonibacter tanglangensis TaxID=2750084 RepID=A0ABW9ZD67_9HYPH|nr:hypothetical protein [Pannonibacter sp. XCT-34]NBN62780.1 hypothetical protein [Pannonibacter sp. XCT-34]